MHVENFNSFVVFSFSHVSKIPRAIELLLIRCLFVETEKPQLRNSSGFVHVVWSLPVFHSLNLLEILCLIDVNCHLLCPLFSLSHFVRTPQCQKPQNSKWTVSSLTISLLGPIRCYKPLLGCLSIVVSLMNSTLTTR